VAVIPGYALPLLEGCGTMQPGTLKVIAKTEAVPFITVFVSDAMPPSTRQKLLACLMAVNKDAKLLKALESRDGFKLLGETPSHPSAFRASDAGMAADWPDWRGPKRDGHVPRLPARLADSLRIIWKKATPEGGLAGLSVSEDRLIVAERDLADEHDFYRCLRAETGELLWAAQFPARGKLDYGQAPRASPVIRDGRVYVLGALGGLRCLRLSDGKVLWERNLPREFKTPPPTWGMCSTPLLVGDVLIVNPGASNASVVALDANSGRTRWRNPGQPAAYSSFVLGNYGGKQQAIGYDRVSLGGWDLLKGQRLWRMAPPHEGDFNVPTPILAGGGIILSTENNGTRFYSFDLAGRLEPNAAAECAALAPTTMTPVVTQNRLFGVHSGLFCLDIQKGLRTVWRTSDESLGEHASLFADDGRVLILTMNGELLLLDARADTCAITSKLKIFDSDVEVYSHPALVGSRLFARGGNTLLCVDIAPESAGS
jgi:outer membrane protein assembly factor BamB